MANRLDLQTTLENILGSRNVYYQPPASVKMSYPAIVYALSSINDRRAGNGVYIRNISYDVTVIYRDPDSELPRIIANLPMCSHSRHYVADNLYHDTFTLYF